MIVKKEISHVAFFFSQLLTIFLVTTPTNALEPQKKVH
jgi:hypothetical protein